MGAQRDEGAEAHNASIGKVREEKGILKPSKTQPTSTLLLNSRTLGEWGTHGCYHCLSAPSTVLHLSQPHGASSGGVQHSEAKNPMLSQNLQAKYSEDSCQTFLFLKAIWIFLLRVNCSLLRRDAIFVYIGKFNFCNKARENGTSSHGSLGFHTHVLALLTEFLGQLRVRIKLWQVEKRGSSLSWEDYIALTRRDLVQGTYSQNLG